MAFDTIKAGGDDIPGIRDHWAAWAQSAHNLYMRFVSMLEGASPLQYQKSASLGFLTNSAALAGYLPMTEHDAFEGVRLDSWGGYGTRADFCFHTGNALYYFKVRRAGRPASSAYLQRQMHQALDRLKVDKDRNPHRAAGCVVAIAGDARAVKICEGFGRSEFIDVSYRIGPSVEPVFLFFRLKE